MQRDTWEAMAWGVRIGQRFAQMDRMEQELAAVKDDLKAISHRVRRIVILAMLGSAAAASNMKADELGQLLGAALKAVLR